MSLATSMRQNNLKKFTEVCKNSRIPTERTAGSSKQALRSSTSYDAILQLWEHGPLEMPAPILRSGHRRPRKHCSKDATPQASSDRHRAGYHGPRPAGPTRQIPCSPPTSHEPRHRRLTKRHKHEMEKVTMQLENLLTLRRQGG